MKLQWCVYKLPREGDWKAELGKFTERLEEKPTLGAWEKNRNRTWLGVKQAGASDLRRRWLTYYTSTEHFYASGAVPDALWLGSMEPRDTSLAQMLMWEEQSRGQG